LWHEAHCVSEWGHGFRHAYKSGLLGLTRLRWYTNAVKLATSATVNTRTQRDLEPLGVAGGWQVVRGPLLHSNLEIRILEAANKQAKERWLVDSLQVLRQLIARASPCVFIFTPCALLSPLQMLWQDQNVLIFYNTQNAVNRCAELLVNRGIDARGYHGEMDKQTRSYLETSFKDGRLRVLVATEALGMGFDKPDIHVVVHMETPSSPIRYYQEIGRAGRALEKGRAYLVPSRPFNTDRSCATAWRHAYKRLKLSPAGLRQQDLRDALITTHSIRAKIADAAISNATSKGYLVLRNGVIQLSPQAREIEEGQDDFIASREEEMKWMERFPAMRECLWRGLLVHMQRPPAADWVCNKCSVCVPEVDDEIQADAAADMEVCYKATTPGGVPVYSLGMHQDQVLLDSEKIRAILAQFVQQLSIGTHVSWLLLLLVIRACV
jgi:ATP-dependent DNA helicase RecQ